MQLVGEFVDMLVVPENTCGTQACVKRTAHAMHVDIDWAQASVIVVQRTGTTIEGPPRYRLFALVGDEKIPAVQSIGDMSMYLNQRALIDDKNSVESQEQLRAFASYDVVVLSSHSMEGRYESLIAPAESAAKQRGLLIPQRLVVYPPVAMLEFQSDKEDGCITMASLFFDDGSKTKNHLEAIRAFTKLKELSSRRVKLYLIGEQAPGHDDYTRKVRALAEEVGDVSVMVGSGRAELEHLVARTSVVWSLSSPSGSNPDSAITEQLGSAVVEAMSTGAIPVLANSGLLREIVGNSAQHLSSSVDDFVRKTLSFLSLGETAMIAQRRQSRELAERFTGGEFDRRFTSILENHELAFYWRPLAKQLVESEMTLPVASKNAAVIVETRSHITFPLVVKMNMHMLTANGDPWTLYVFHGSENGKFCKNALADFENIVYTDLGVATLSGSAYNQLLKAEVFWTSMASSGVEKVLVFQPHSLLVGRGIEKFLKWDYVGAPWTTRNHIYDGIDEGGVRFPKLPRWARVGDGGLSIRSTGAMINVIRKHGASSMENEREDVFFIRHLQAMGYAVADTKSASEFALHMPMREFGHAHVLGLNQAWRHMPSPQQRKDLAKFLAVALDSIAVGNAAGGAAGAGAGLSRMDAREDGRAPWHAQLPGSSVGEFLQS